MKTPGSVHQLAGQVGMDSASRNRNLIINVGDGLSDLAAEELQHILDGVRQRHAGAQPEAIVRELHTFRRVRELQLDVIRCLAEDSSTSRTRYALI